MNPIPRMASPKTRSIVIEDKLSDKQQPVEPQLVENAACPWPKAGRAPQLPVVADDGRYASDLAVIVQHMFSTTTVLWYAAAALYETILSGTGVVWFSNSVSGFVGQFNLGCVRVVWFS